MEDRTLENCVFVKTILMFLVILGHACAFWSGHWFTENPAIQSLALDIFNSWISSFHIYAFTLISGYIFAFKVIRGERYSIYILFLQNKARRLLIPYLFVMLIWVAPISAYFFNWDLLYLFKKYILCIDPSQLWFLWMLFDVFVIVWPMRKVMVKQPVIGWAIAVIFYGIGIVGIRILPNVFCIWTACRYVLLFYIGMRIRCKEENGKKLMIEAVSWMIWVIVDIALFVTASLISCQNGVIWRLMSKGLNFVLHIAGAIMAWTTLQTIAFYIHWNDSKIFRTLSSYTMPMYLFHQQIIYFTIQWLNGKVDPWINAGVNFIVSLVASFVISAILMRWKVTSFLIGEKRNIL